MIIIKISFETSLKRTQINKSHLSFKSICQFGWWSFLSGFIRQINDSPWLISFWHFTRYLSCVELNYLQSKSALAGGECTTLHFWLYMKTLQHWTMQRRSTLQDTSIADWNRKVLLGSHVHKIKLLETSASVECILKISTLSNQIYWSLLFRFRWKIRFVCIQQTECFHSQMTFTAALIHIARHCSTQHVFPMAYDLRKCMQQNPFVCCVLSKQFSHRKNKQAKHRENWMERLGITLLCD